MVSRHNTGRLSNEAQRRLAEILEIIRQDLRYLVETSKITGDLSRVIGESTEVRLRRHNEEVARIRTIYEGVGRRTAIIHSAYRERLASYDHKLEALDEFLKDEGYEIVVHQPKEKGDDKAKKTKK